VNLYLDTAYIAKCYINEVDSPAVRKLARGAEGLYSSVWCLAEMACVFHRRVREKGLTSEQARKLDQLFREDVQSGVWILLPVSQGLMQRVEAVVQNLPPDVFLRAGDAVHLVSAREAGFTEIWTGDGRLLAAAPHFHLGGRAV
jgi:predicted nucleic acid-binding protein